MSILQNSNAISAPAGGDFYDHQISKSCRFIGSANDDGTNYMYHTRGTPTNADKCTISAWVKRSKLGSKNLMFTGAGSGSAYSWYGFNTANEFWHLQAGDQPRLESTALYRDPSAWMHIVIANDSTQGTAANRNKVYINGVQYTDWGDHEDYSTQNADIAVNTSGVRLFVGSGGASASNSYYPFDGYIAEYVFIDGTQYAASDFGETKNGVWIPKDPSGLTFGNNGAYLKFESSGDLGNDSSGNNNDFTVAAIAAHDQMLDSPTFGGGSNGGNFCTWNPLDAKNVAVPTEGNLKVTHNGSLYNQIRGTMGIGNSGKWYMELYKSGTYSTYPAWGICDQSQILTSSKNIPGYYAVSMIGVSWDFNSEAVFKNLTYADSYGTQVNMGSTASTYTNTAQIIGMAIDLDNNKIFTHVNGTWDSACGNPSSGGSGFNASSLSGVNNLVPVIFPSGYNTPTYVLVGGFGADSTFGGLTAAGSGTDTNGYGNFKYSVPTDYKAICSGNLTTAAAVNPAQTDDDFPQKLFNTKLYTGNAGTNNITGLGFKPDLTWIKIRNTASNAVIVDSSRGTNKMLHSTTNSAEVTTGNLTAFGTDGFSLDGTTNYLANYNGNSNTYAAWNWRANKGVTSTNSTGTVNTTQQVDPSGGFSISTYAGTGSSMTVGHGLSAEPKLTIIKDRSTATDWVVYTKVIDGSLDYFELNTTDAAGNSGFIGPNASIWNFNAESGYSNTSGRNYVMYNFTDVEGYIKVGTYVGNGNNDGTFCFTGHKSAFLLIREVAADNWLIYDNKRLGYNLDSAGNAVLYADYHGAEENQASRAIDLLANGFKLRTSNATGNSNGATYVFLSMSSNPFKYSTAR